MKVKVYRNLKHGRNAPPLYSVMHKGRVIARLPQVLLGNATFHVNEAGRQRVIQQKRKNVHAFVVGELANMDAPFIGGYRSGVDIAGHVRTPGQCIDRRRYHPAQKEKGVDQTT